MSHFTELQTEINQVDRLKKILEQKSLNFQHHPGKAMVRGFCDELIPCDLKIETGTPYDIGLKVGSNGNYEFVADWEMLAFYKITQETFAEPIIQAYAHSKVVDELLAQGYTIESETVDENGNIALEVSQWA